MIAPGADEWSAYLLVGMLANAVRAHPDRTLLRSSSVEVNYDLLPCRACRPQARFHG